MKRPAKLRAKAFARQLARQGFREPGRAMQTVDPSLTWGSARTLAWVALTSIDGQKAVMAELSKIATPDELREFFTDFVRNNAKPDLVRLKAGEVMARIHAMLTDRSINLNVDVDATKDALSKAADEALQGLKHTIETPVPVGEGSGTDLPSVSE